MTEPFALPARKPPELQPADAVAQAVSAAGISPPPGIDAALRAVLHEILRMTGAQSAEICVLDGAADELVTRMVHGRARPFTPDVPLRMPVDEHPFGSVIREDAPLLIERLPARMTQPAPHAGGESVEAVAAVPIHAAGRVTGVVSIMSSRPGAFDAHGLELLRSMSVSLGSALDLARSYDESLAVQRRLNAVLQAATGGILAIDADGRIQLVNPAAERLLNLRAAELLQQPLASAPLPVRMRLLALSAMSATGQARNHSLRMKLNEDFVLSVTISPMFVDQEREGWVLLLQDITHLAQAEQMRSAFLKAAAHDMRNPLSAAIQSLALARRLAAGGNPALDEALDIAQSGMGRIQRLIDDLLTLEMIQNHSEFSPTQVDIGEFAFEISAAARSRAEARGLQFRTVLASLPPVSADRRILSIAVEHYLANALAHAPAGSEVTLRFFREHNHLHITVSDSGPGIPVEAQARVFERFIPLPRPDDSTTGFGLAIVKAAVEAHGGSVYLHSGVGAGSTFGLMIPLASVVT